MWNYQVKQEWRWYQIGELSWGDKDAKWRSGWESMKGSAVKGEEKEEGVQARENGNAVQLYNTPSL